MSVPWYGTLLTIYNIGQEGLVSQRHGRESRVISARNTRVIFHGERMYIMSMIFKGRGGSARTKLFTIVAAVTLTGAAAVMPFAAMADATIDALMAQIAALQAQLAALTGGSSMTAPAGACAFTRSLTMGSRGEDVTCLQSYLMSTGHFTYAGGATGYFGNITKSAVAAWQAANGVSPAAGYFGPISRAKYDALVAMATPLPTATLFPTPTPTISGSPVVPAGSGLSVVASSDQPADGALAPPNAMRVPVLGVVFTASNDGDVTVKNLVVERTGQADDTAIDSIVLLDDNKVQIGLSKTLSSLHQVTLNEAFTVAKGTSKKMWIAFNRPAAGSNGGQIAKFKLVSVDAGTSAVSGALPIMGPGVTINETLTIGSLASPARGILDPGAARTALQVGSKAFYASGARWTVGSAEPVSLEQVRFYQAGSAGAGDLENVKVTVKGVDYSTQVSSDGKYYTAVLNPSVIYDKGANIDLAIKADVVGGSNRTIDFDLQKRTDIVARGTVFNYYILPAAGTATNSSTQGEGFTTSEPYYDAYLHTISLGTLRIEKNNAVEAGNIAPDTSNVTLGSFGFDAKGENVQISSTKLTYAISSGAYTSITNVSIVDENGVTVAGPKDAVSGLTTTYSDTYTVPVGYHVYKILGKVSSSFADGTTISVSIDPDGDITAKGETTGLTITASPTSAISANTQTIRTAALKVSVSDSPQAQNVVRGINGFLFAKVQYDGTASGEDLRVTSQVMTMTTSGSADPDNLNSCQMFDGTTALNTGGNVISPSGNSTGSDIALTFTMDQNLIIPKGTVKLIDVKCNIDSSATASETWSIGLTAATGNDTTVAGAVTGTSVTETTTNNVGPTMTVRSAGSLSVALDPSSPSERFGIAGKTDVAGSVFKLTSQYEALKLTKFGFNLASSTASTSDVVKVSFWDGATRVGEAVFTANNEYGTSTLTSDFIVPKDADKVLSSTVDLIAKDAIGKANQTGGDSGHLVIINWSGGYPTATESIGQSSGTKINTATTTDTAAKGIRVVKAYPTLTRLSVPTNTLTNGDMDLYRFSVSAPTDGDIGLYKFTFRVSSTTVATTSSFRVFAYTDSGFSTQAYGANPINSNSNNCVGSDVRYSTTTTCHILGVPGDTPSTRASSSVVAIYFDPVTNVTATPATNQSNQNSEQIQVPAGQTRYFKLVGNVARTTTGDSFNVALVGDASFFPTLGTRGGQGLAADTLAIAGQVASSSFFVWSPDTTTTAATTTNDWLNGYLLPGLPTTEMSQQSFSK